MTFGPRTNPRLVSLHGRNQFEFDARCRQTDLSRSFARSIGHADGRGSFGGTVSGHNRNSLASRLDRKLLKCCHDGRRDRCASEDHSLDAMEELLLQDRIIAESDA